MSSVQVARPSSTGFLRPRRGSSPRAHWLHTRPSYLAITCAVSWGRLRGTRKSILGDDIWKFSIHERCSHSKFLYFLRDLAFTYSVSGSPEEYRICFYCETASRAVSVFSISLSSTVDTCSCVSLSRLSRISHIFYEKRDFAPRLRQSLLCGCFAGGVQDV